MRFPAYPASTYKSPPVPVIQGYINFFGLYERDYRAQIDTLPKTSVNQIAMRIGRGCLIAADGNDKAADRVFRRAQRDLEPTVATPGKRRTKAGRYAAQLLSTAQLLELRHDAPAVAEARQSGHLQTTRDIERLYAQLTRADDRRPRGGARADMHGELVQSVTLGLLTRYSAHPWAMGQAALLHHDRGQVQSHNFDLLFVETSSEQELTASHKVQIKSGCLGLCDDHLGKAIDRSLYDSDIVFVSGCCDLGFRSPADEQNYGLAALLIKEAHDEATLDELEALDMATSRLMISASFEHPHRMGLLPVDLAA